jgi:hypothetical protein
VCVRQPVGREQLRQLAADEARVVAELACAGLVDRRDPTFPTDDEENVSRLVADGAEIEFGGARDVRTSILWCNRDRTPERAAGRTAATRLLA